MRDYTELLKSRLSEKRYLHSLGVRDTARSLAEHYGCSPEKAAIAGLLHDITKNCTEQEHLQMLAKYGVYPEPGLLRSKNIFHQITGAYYVREELGIDDEEIFAGIRYHTTGRANMTLFEKIIYMADFIEPGRNYDMVDDLRRMAYEDLDGACFTGVRFCIEKNVGQGVYIYKDTFDFYNELTEEKQ